MREIMDEPYENKLTLDEIRREARKQWDDAHALGDALVSLPEVPPTNALRALISAAMNTRGIDLWAIGKQVQRDHDGVPFKTEYECAVGLWTIIRAAILTAKNAAAET